MKREIVILSPDVHRDEESQFRIDLWDCFVATLLANHF